MNNALALLLPFAQKQGRNILCLDENTEGHTFERQDNCQVYSNRYDVAAAIEGAEFSDWIFGNEMLDRFIFPLSKEKASNHFLINQACKRLAPGGELIFAGQKNQGVKSYSKNLSALFPTINIEKNGAQYLVRAQKPAGHIDPSTLLNDQDYQQQRAIFELAPNLAMHSKPGQFGWNKQDKGSEFLVSTISDELIATPPKRLFDLGCGYGFISCTIGLHHTLEHITATDNNAAAIASCAMNLENLSSYKAKAQTQASKQQGGDIANEATQLEKTFSFEVVAADCAQGIDGHYDTVVCNPPFHQGFSVENSLTDKFLKACKDHLQKDGNAYFVVNSFIGLENKAKKYFSHIDTLANNKQFKVLRLRK